jgi:hypothetical protein
LKLVIIYYQSHAAKKEKGSHFMCVLITFYDRKSPRAARKQAEPDPRRNPI